jgi:CheY-like chemotaxis protein
MKLDDMGLAFPQECLRVALLVSLLSVWALVGLFYYLNRYTRRFDFSIWTGAWLFYAMWLTLSLGFGDATPGSLLFTINQSCVSISAVLLLWGSLRFLNIPVPRRLSSVFAIFLMVWILVSPQMMTDALRIHLPVFILLGLSSPFAGVCFLRLQKQKAFVGVGMLSLGFLLWVIYIGSYPFPAEYGNLYSAGFCIAAALQLVIAVSMIGLLFREVRLEAQQVRAAIEAVRLEHSKVISAKEACQSLYNEMRAAEETEKAMVELHRARQAVVERERLQALGQMAGDVAHDLNNALSPITAYSEMLLSTLPDLPEVPRAQLQRIRQAAENVAQIVAHMREFYRPGSALEPSELKPSITLHHTGEHCRPLRILCIDDEPELRQLLHDVLEMEHHQVTVATGGQEGLDLFLTNLHAGHPYEVVITDLGMPDIDGHDVTRAIKAESPQTPVIMLTGWGTMIKADGRIASGVDAVLGKPPRRQELSDLLMQVTERSAN